MKKKNLKKNLSNKYLHFISAAVQTTGTHIDIRCMHYFSMCCLL